MTRVVFRVGSMQTWQTHTILLETYLTVFYTVKLLCILFDYIIAHVFNLL